MSNNAQVGPDLATSALPEMLGFSDLERVNEALFGLFAGLRLASRLYAENDFSDRAATLVALDASWLFLMQFQVVLDELLHLPLMNLSGGLLALNNNDVRPILRPATALKGGRTLDPPDRQVLIGVAVGTVGRLRWTGMPVPEARRQVAAELARLGIKPARGAGQITARTVKQWSERVSAARPASRAPFSAGGPKTPANAQPADIIAVQNADKMLSPKWRSLIERQPPDKARAFVLDFLRKVIQAKVADGNTPRSVEKPVNPPS